MDKVSEVKPKRGWRVKASHDGSLSPRLRTKKQATDYAAHKRIIYPMVKWSVVRG